VLLDQGLYEAYFWELGVPKRHGFRTSLSAGCRSFAGDEEEAVGGLRLF